jgi:hypothetical protein
MMSVNKDNSLEAIRKKIKDFNKKYSEERTTWASSGTNTDPFGLGSGGNAGWPYGNDPYIGYPQYPGNSGWDSSGTGTVDMTALQLTQIMARLDAIEKRLRIMEDADPDLVEALKEAYDHYKFIEKLCEDSLAGRED